MSSRRGWEDEEKLAHIALTVSRSSKGKASRDCTRHQTLFTLSRSTTDLLELEIGPLVCHPLVPHTELARRGMGRFWDWFRLGNGLIIGGKWD
jgi:hypothetical protein